MMNVLDRLAQRLEVLVLSVACGTNARAYLIGVCCCSRVNSRNQVRGHWTGSSHSGVEEYPREKTQANLNWYMHISYLKQLMAPPEEYKK